MSAITYKSPEILNWFGESAKASKSKAKDKAGAVAKTASDVGFVDGLKQAASAAIDLGKGALGDFVTKQAEGTTFVLYPTGFESNALIKTKRVDYSAVRQIVALANDRFQILYDGGNLTIRPIAHLVAGRLRVPIGWVRNGMEVPYAMLIDELAARCGVEIDSE